MSRRGRCKPDSIPGVDRRNFLKSAAAVGSAAWIAPHSVKTQPPGDEQQASAAPVPSEARVEAEAGPATDWRELAGVIENPASDFMVDVLKQMEFAYVTTNPGSSFESLHESLVNYGGNRMPEMLTCLHEESAVAMAHGYAKIEGKPLMVLLHGTVGLLHGAMAIYNAYADRVPVYILVGNHRDPQSVINQYHSAQDLGALARDYIKWDFDTTEVGQFAEAAMRGYSVAMTPPMGPVLLSIDHAMQGEPLDDDARPRMPSLTMPAPPRGDDNAVRELARMLVEAERPAIVTGRSARTPAGIDYLVELAELLQVPVSGSERVNFPWTHPLYGGGGQDYRPDMTLALEVNDMSGIARAARARGGRSAGISTVAYHHGSNIHDYGRYADLDLAIAADAEATLPALTEAVRERLNPGIRRQAATRGEAVTSAHAEGRAAARENARYGWNASPVSLARLCAEVWEQIRHDDWSLVSWQTFIGSWPGRLWDISRHYHYIGGQGGGGIGYGLPAAVGAALANKAHGRLSVNIQTDGDLNYAPGVLWTAVHHQIPLLTVMANNRAYHAEVMYVQQNASLHGRGHHNAHIGTKISDPDIDYAGMARSYGMYAEGPVSNPADLAGVLSRALERVRAGEPALVDVVTQPR